MRAQGGSIATTGRRAGEVAPAAVKTIRGIRRPPAYLSCTFSTLWSCPHHGAPVSGEPPACPFLSLPGFFFPVSRRRTRCQRTDQPVSSRGHLINRALKCSLVRVRWATEATQFPDKLKCRRGNLLVSRRRIEVSEGPDIPAHASTSVGRNIHPCHNDQTGTAARPGKTSSRPDARGSLIPARCQART